MKNSELFNAFVVVAHERNWTDKEMPSSLWVRSSTNRKWSPLVNEADPYRLLPVAIAMTSDEADAEAMILMYGWVTALDPDTMEPKDDGERKRIRVMIHMNRGKESVAVQRLGETVEEFDDFGEGFLVDTVASLRTAQRRLPLAERDNAMAIQQMAMSGLLSAIFNEGDDE